MLFVLSPNFADTNPGLLDSQGNPRVNTSYDDIQKGNELRSNAGSTYDKLVDFRSYSNISDSFKHASYEPYAREEDTSDANGAKGRKELLLTKLREDAKSPDVPFDGIGDSDRGSSDRPAKNASNIDSVKDPSSRTKKDYATKTYRALGKLAAEKKDKLGNVDFRTSDEDSGAQEFVVDGETEALIKRLDSFDTNGTTTEGPNRHTLKPNQAPNTDDTPIIAKYRTLAYDEIGTIANKLTTNKAFVHYNRKDEQGKISFWNGIATNFDTTLRKYNQAVTSDPDNDGVDLIRFKFNDITFRAYIDTISDSYSPGYGSESDQNRADPRYLYTSFERKVQISFKVVYEHSGNAPWPKLKKLANLTTPGYGGGPWGQGVFVTIGKLFNNEPMLIESLTYDWDNETPWSLKGDQADNYDGLPMYTQVQIGLIYLGDVKPAKGNGYALYGE